MQKLISFLSIITLLSLSNQSAFGGLWLSKQISPEWHYDPSQPTPIMDLPNEMLLMIVREALQNGNFTDFKNLFWINKRFQSLVQGALPEKDRQIIEEYNDTLKKIESLQYLKQQQNKFFNAASCFFFDPRNRWNIETIYVIVLMFLKCAPKFNFDIFIIFKTQDSTLLQSIRILMKIPVLGDKDDKVIFKMKEKKIAPRLIMSHLTCKAKNYRNNNQN